MMRTDKEKFAKSRLGSFMTVPGRRLSKKSLYFKCVLTIPNFPGLRRALKGRKAIAQGNAL